MISALFNQPTYQGARAMMDVTAKRAEAIASNISNLETPNYKRLDVAPAFESALKSALESGNTQQLQALQPTLAVDEKAIVTGKDGNSVVLEDELMAMNQNTLEHQFEVQAVSSALLKLRMAITGRPS